MDLKYRWDVAKILYPDDCTIITKCWDVSRSRTSLEGYLGRTSGTLSSIVDDCCCWNDTDYYDELDTAYDTFYVLNQRFKS